jgi:hypothetical protein
MIEGRKFLELRVSTAYGGGFPPDHLFWEKENDKVSYYDGLEFSGDWIKQSDQFSYATYNNPRRRSWDWKETTDGKVDFVPKWAGKEVRASKSYKILGFRSCGGHKYTEAVPNMWTPNKYDTVWHERDSYTLVVEILE